MNNETLYAVKPTTRFRKDYKKMEKRNMDMSLLDSIIVLLADGKPLPPANRDHALTGNYAGHRSCHILPDWVLIYQIYKDVLVLSLTRTGSHSDVY